MTAEAPTKTLTLYEIESDLQAYLDTEADVPAELQEEFRVALSAAGQAALDKRDNAIRAFQVLDSQIEFCKAEKKRISERQTTLENGQKRFRRYLAGVLESLPLPPKKGKQQPAKKLEGRIGVISLRKGSESVEVVTPAQLSPTLCDLTVTLPADLWFVVDRKLHDVALESKDPGLMSVSMAFHGAQYSTSPNKAKVKAFIEQCIADEVAGSFDLEVADEEDKPAILAAIAEAVYMRVGARIKTGEPTVVVT